MLILIHVITALVSMGVSTLAAVRPSAKRVVASYGLIGATVGSGTILIVMNSADVLKSCLVGLAYLVVVTFLSVVAHRRLQHTAAKGE